MTVPDNARRSLNDTAAQVFRLLALKRYPRKHFPLPASKLPV